MSSHYPVPGRNPYIGSQGEPLTRPASEPTAGTAERVSDQPVGEAIDKAADRAHRRKICSMLGYEIASISTLPSWREVYELLSEKIVPSGDAISNTTREIYDARAYLSTLPYNNITDSLKERIEQYGQAMKIRLREIDQLISEGAETLQQRDALVQEQESELADNERVIDETCTDRDNAIERAQFLEQERSTLASRLKDLKEKITVRDNRILDLETRTRQLEKQREISVAKLANAVGDALDKTMTAGGSEEQ